MTQATEQRIICPICRAPNRGDARFCQQCGSDVLLDDLYRITKVIKAGGTGLVYKAIDAAGVEYAIKEMHDKFATQEERDEGIQRFIEEAEMLHNLNHPSIPQVYRSFIDEDRYYLSMEFIHGEDLEDIVKREKRIPEPQVLEWAEQICDVLDYMHTAGLIYRDMKPANIMIDRDRNVKVVDFGIAKLLEPGQRNTMVGTPGYSPPEQYQGLATIESDIYALGATLHHLLTGRDPRDHPPFTFPLVTTLNPVISVQTAKAIDKALAMEVGDRFHSVDAFRRALPIPTGDRRWTLPFDLGGVEEAPAPAAPAPPPARRPAPARQPAAPVRQPAAPVRQPATARTAARPRRGRGVLRRVATALVLAGVLAGGTAIVAPEVVPVVTGFVSDLINQAGSVLPASAPVYQEMPFQTNVSVTLPADAADADILAALRTEYVEAAQATHPGSRLNELSRPSVLGGYWEASEVTNNQRTFSATMTGTIDVPQPQQ